MNQVRSFCQPVGSSKDCICTSSSLTTPPTPSLVIERLTTVPVAAPETAALAYDDGSPSRPPQHRTPVEADTDEVDGCAVIDRPPRAIAIASISSMKPIAPPSWRAALRSALKYERILRAVAP